MLLMAFDELLSFISVELRPPRRERVLDQRAIQHRGRRPVPEAAQIQNSLVRLCAANRGSPKDYVASLVLEIRHLDFYQPFAKGQQLPGRFKSVGDERDETD